MDPLVLKMAQKVVKSVDNVTIRSCETLQPSGSFCLLAGRDELIQTRQLWTKQPQEKQTGGPNACKFINVHTYLYNGGEICVLKWCTYKTPSCKSGHISIAVSLL